MRYWLCFLFIGSTLLLQAQDTSKRYRDSARRADSARHTNRYFDSSLFSDANVLSASDYLIAIERMQESLNQVPLVTSSFSQADAIQKKLSGADSAILVVQQGLALDTRVLSLRNIQMFQTLVDDLKENNDNYKATIDLYEERLDSLKKNILGIRKDSVLRHMFRDSVLRKSFAAQLQPIRVKWRQTDTLVRQATQLINNLKVQLSQNDITLKELEYQADKRLNQL